MALASFLASIRNNSFVRSVGVLAGGTALSQAISLGAMPILTRMYSPTEFSVYAVYVAAVTILSVVAGLRLEIAIPLPEDEADATRLLVLALGIAITIGVLTGVCVLAAPETIAHGLGHPQLSSYLWLLPLGVFLAGGYNIVRFWAVRNRYFSGMASATMGQTVCGAFTQVGLGLLNFGPLGLIVGQIVNAGTGLVALLRYVHLPRQRVGGLLASADLKRVWKAYQRFPKFSALEALANNAGIQAPIIIIASVAVGPEAGFLALAMRVMQAPMALMGGAVSQVYLSHAAEEYRAGTLKRFTVDTVTGLVKVGVGPLVFAGIVAPQVFALVFGENWHRSGVLAAWLAPCLAVQFVASSVSMALHVTGNQHKALWLQLFGLAFRGGSVLLCGWFAKDYIVETYAISGLLFYLVYFWTITSLLAVRARDLTCIVRKTWRILMLWVLFGGACAVTLTLAAVWWKP